MALEFNEMSKQGQWGTIGGICVVAIGVFYIYVWSPRADETALLSQEIADIQLENQRTRQIAGDLEQLETELAVLEGQLETLSNILPEAQQTGTILRTLQQTATDVALEVRRFDPQTVVLHDFYAEVPIQLDLVGNYHDLALFFDRVSKFGRIVTVGEVSIRGLELGTDGTIEATCTASTFYFLPDAQVVDPDAAETTGG